LPSLSSANIKQADIISDRLRREAGRVAEKAMLLTKQITHKDQLQQLKKDLERAENERQQLIKVGGQGSGTRWESIIVHPGKWTQWANDFKLLVQKVKDLRSRRTKSDELQKISMLHRLNLIKHLFILEETKSNQDNDSLITLIKKSQSIIPAEEELLRKREQLLRDKKKLGNELQAAGSRLESSEKDLSDWQKQWEQAVSP
jgi:hypothetical protein